MNFRAKYITFVKRGDPRSAAHHAAGCRQNRSFNQRLPRDRDTSLAARCSNASRAFSASNYS